jgi:hypothetical protein
MAYQSPQQPVYTKINSTEALINPAACDLPLNGGDQANSVEFNQRLYLLMKEQIEIAAANYR